MHSLEVDAALVLVVIASIGAAVMACWPRASRRSGIAIVVLAIIGAVLSVVGDGWGRGWSAVLLAFAVLGFWLIDRGIPGNRQRPAWVRAYAVLLIGIAVAATWLQVS